MHVGHQVGDLRTAVLRCLCTLEHDRAEGTGCHDGVGTRLLELLEPDIGDARGRLFLRIGEEEPSARTATEGVRAVALGLDDLFPPGLPVGRVVEFGPECLDGVFGSGCVAIW